MQTKFTLDGLDGFFTALYRGLGWLFSPIIQALLLVILIGGWLFGGLFWQQTFALSGNGRY